MSSKNRYEVNICCLIPFLSRPLTLGDFLHLMEIEKISLIRTKEAIEMNPRRPFRSYYSTSNTDYVLKMIITTLQYDEARLSKVFTGQGDWLAGWLAG